MKKILILLVHVLILVSFIFLAKDLNNDFDISDILGADNIEVTNYKKYKKKYDDERTLYVLTISDRELLLKTNILTQKLLHIRGLETVNSISLVQYLRYDKEQRRVQLRKFYNTGELSARGGYLLQNSGLFKNAFLNETQNASLTTVKIRKGLSKSKITELINSLNIVKEELSSEETKYHLLGTKLASYFFSKELIDQQTLISPLSLLIIIGFLLFVFRSMGAVFLGLYYMTFVFLLSAIVIFFFEKGITPYTNFSLFFIYVMATSDFIHFCHSYSNESGELKEKLSNSVKKVIKPCFYTTLTTATAFFSLALSPIKVIADFGLYSAVGIIISFVINFYALPYVLESFRLDVKISKSNFLSFFNTSYLKHIRYLKLPLFLLSSLILILFPISLKKLNFDDSLYDKFVKTHPMTESVYKFNEMFNFTGSVDLVRKVSRDELYSAKYEKETKIFINKIEQIENVSIVRGISKYLDYIREEVKASSDDSFTSHGQLRNILSLMQKQKITKDHYNNIYHEEKITIYLKSLKSSELKKTINKITKLIEEQNLSYELNGFAPIRLKMLNSILDGVLYNLLGTFAVIFVIFCFAFKSIRMGLIGMIPNIFPVMLILILMSYFNIAIEDSLILMLSSIIGISVDDTLHYMFAYLDEDRKRLHLDKVKSVFKKTHFALFTTTFLFVIVSPTYFISNLSLIHKMAIFFNIGLLSALICDFYLLPFFMKWGASKNEA